MKVECNWEIKKDTRRTTRIDGSLKSRMLDIFSHSRYAWWYKPLLEDKRRFPDSSFSASATSEGHNAPDTKISRGGSWCAPVSDKNHYLQVALGRLYCLQYLVTYAWWPYQRKYTLNYIIDLVIWKTKVRNNDITTNNSYSINLLNLKNC
jgi:hypothetical protein